MQFAHIAGVDLNLLVALTHLYETGSVTAAARRMKLSQPAMSRVLGRLRTTFNDPLFLRTPKGLRPTPRAEQLRPQVEDTLARLDELVAGPAAFDPSTSTRDFVIATADYAMAVILPALLTRLRRDAPKVTLRLVPLIGDLVENLDRGTWDLGWAPRRNHPPSSALVWNPLLDEDFAFVLRAGHPLAKGRLTLDRFCAIEQLAISPGGNINPVSRLDAALTRLGRQRRVVAHVPNFLVVPQLVADSDLGAVLPRRLLSLVQTQFKLTSFPLPLEVPGFDMSQAFHERMRHEPGHAWLRRLVREVMAAPSKGHD